MTTLDSLLNDASSFVGYELGFDIEKSQLKLYSLEKLPNIFKIKIVLIYGLYKIFKFVSEKSNLNYLIFIQ